MQITTLNTFSVLCSLHKLIVMSFSIGVSQVQVQGSPPTLLGGLPVGPGITPQPGFLYHGVWVPLTVTFSAGSAKSV